MAGPRLHGNFRNPLQLGTGGLIAAHEGVQPENIVVGEGIDGLLGYLVRLLIGPGDAVVTSDGAYPTFNYHVAGFGADLITVPYVDDREDPQSLLAAAREHDARLVYLANPDNPMGTWWEGAQIEEMVDALPPGCLLVLDEAYCDFAPADALRFSPTPCGPRSTVTPSTSNSVPSCMAGALMAMPSW